MRTIISYASTHHGSTRRLVQAIAQVHPLVLWDARTLPAGKAVFALFTCARDNGSYGDEVRTIAAERRCTYLGKFGCRGYNTYGPWKLIGGMNKGHPTPEECAAAVRFYEGLSE